MWKLIVFSTVLSTLYSTSWSIDTDKIEKTELQKKVSDRYLELKKNDMTGSSNAKSGEVTGSGEIFTLLIGGKEVEIHPDKIYTLKRLLHKPVTPTICAQPTREREILSGTNLIDFLKDKNAADWEVIIEHNAQ